MSEEVIPAVRDCSAFADEGSRMSLYMHDPEAVKARWTKLIPVVLVSKLKAFPRSSAGQR